MRLNLICIGNMFCRMEADNPQTEMIDNILLYVFGGKDMYMDQYI